MKIETTKLRTITNFAKEQELSRMHVYRLIEAGTISTVSIDGVNFIHLDEKTNTYQRKRKARKSKKA